VKGKADPKQILLLLKKGGQHATLEWISHGIPREEKVQKQGNGNYNNHMMIPQDPFYHGTYPYPYDHNVYHQFNHPYPNWYNMPQNTHQVNHPNPNWYNMQQNAHQFNHPDPNWYNMPQNAHQFNHPNPNWYNMPQNAHQFNHPNPNWYSMPQNAYPYGNQHSFELQHGTRNMFEDKSSSSGSFDSHGPMRSNNHQDDPWSSSQPYIPPETNNQTDDQPVKRSSLLKKIAAKLCFKS